MGKTSKSKMMASTSSKKGSSETSLQSSSKRLKLTEEHEIASHCESDLSDDFSSPKASWKRGKSSGKGKSPADSSKVLMKCPKKNLTAYAFFIKQVSLSRGHA